MKVLHLLNHAGRGGTEKYVNQLIDEMEKKDVNHVFVYNEKGLLSQKLEEKGIKTFNLEMVGPFDIRAAKKLKEICEEEKPDIIHSHYLRENYIAIISKFFGNKVKIIYTCHFDKVDRGLIRLLNSFFYKKLDKVIAVSKSVKESVIKSGTNKDKVEVVYTGVKEKPKPDNIIKLKKEYKIPDNNFVISSAARFSPEKGNEFLIKSIKVLKELTDKPFKVLLAGDGETFDDCVSLAKDYGISEINFLGYKAKVEDIYKISDVHIVSSKSEGFGLSAIESLSFGVPNIVTNVGGLVEIVNDESNCGITVSYGDDYAMASAIKILMDDKNLKEAFSVNAKEYIKTKFSTKEMIDMTYKIYQEVMR